MMKFDCCLCGLRLYTPCKGSRKQNILSSNYTHVVWIICFGCALFDMHDQIPIFDALVVSQWLHEGGLSKWMPLQLQIRQFRRKLVRKGVKQRIFLPKVCTCLPWKLPVFGDFKKRSSFADCITQFRSRALNLEYLPAFCCFLHLWHSC